MLAAGSNPASSRVVSYVYRLNYRGEAEVTVIVNATGLEKVNVGLEKGYVRGSLTAYSENGTPLYYNVSDGIATVYTYNLSRTAILEYLAVLGNVSNEVLVNVTIHPQAKASVFLPKGTAITYVSGNPDIEFMNGTIVLVYRCGGTYRIDYVIIPPSATRTTSITTPQSSSVTHITSSTASTATRTPHSTVVSTPSTKTTGASPSGTETTTATPATHSSIPVTPSQKSSLHTSKSMQVPGPYPYVWGGVAAACVAGAIAVAYASRKLRRGGGIGDVEVTSGLDERDMMILESLSGGELSLSEIARRVGLNKSVVWRRVNRMMREGYLERRVVKGRTLYRLTVKGLKAVASGSEGGKG